MLRKAKCYRERVKKDIVFLDLVTMRIRILLMQIRIHLFALMRIRIWILLLIKVMRIHDQ
jgi:hypothetical protein